MVAVPTFCLKVKRFKGIPVSSLTSLRAAFSSVSHQSIFHFGATRSIFPERACLLISKNLISPFLS